MHSSTRNQLSGSITQLYHNDTVMVKLDCAGIPIYAQISALSQEQLQLKVGQTAIALIKAPSISIMTDIAPLKLSAENQIAGQITHIEVGAVNTIVTLRVNAQICLSATISLYSSERLALKIGQEVVAVFNAHQVMLAVL